MKQELNKLTIEQLCNFFLLYEKEDIITILLLTFENKELLNKLIEREITC